MAKATPRTILVGDATVTIINAGDMVINMAEVLAVPESEWRPLYGSSLEGLRPFPSQSIHIALPGTSILVDINDYALAESLDPSYFQTKNAPPPGVVEQLLRRAFIQKISPTSSSRTRTLIIIPVSRWNAMEATSHAFPMRASC